MVSRRLFLLVFILLTGSASISTEEANCVRGVQNEAGDPELDFRDEFMAAHTTIHWQDWCNKTLRTHACSCQPEGCTPFPDSREKFFIYEIPAELNEACNEELGYLNWRSDMGLEEWPPAMLGVKANFVHALEPVVFATLSQSSQRTTDPSEASWFYIPFFAGCSRVVAMHKRGSHHARLRLLDKWLQSSPIVQRYLGVEPHVVTVGDGLHLEAVGPTLFPLTALLTLEVNDCMPQPPSPLPPHSPHFVQSLLQPSSSSFSSPSSALPPRSCSRSPCTTGVAEAQAAWAAEEAEGGGREGGGGGWGRGYWEGIEAWSHVALDHRQRSSHFCATASAPWDIAVPYFAEPALALHPEDDAWLRRKPRDIDFFMLAGPHGILRQILEQLFWDYAEQWPGRRAEVRIVSHMSNQGADAAVSSLTYRAQVLQSKLCFVTPGHQQTSRHLANAIAGGCVPVLVGYSETHELPFQHSLPLPYTAFSVRISTQGPEQLLPFLLHTLHSRYDQLFENVLRVREALIAGRGNPLLHSPLRPQWEGSKPLARAVVREVSARVRLWRRRLAARHFLLEPHPLEAGPRRQQL